MMMIYKRLLFVLFPFCFLLLTWFSSSYYYQFHLYIIIPSEGLCYYLWRSFYSVLGCMEVFCTKCIPWLIFLSSRVIKRRKRIIQLFTSQRWLSSLSLSLSLSLSPLPWLRSRDKLRHPREASEWKCPDAA